MRIDYFKRFLTFALLVTTLNTFAQVTTSSMSGDVMTMSYEPIAENVIQLTHEPTQTVYTAVTDDNGTFRLNNIRTGGPYTVKIMDGDDVVYQETNIYTQLGEVYHFSANVGGSINLEEVVVTAKSSGDDRIGAETNLSREELNKLPQVNGGLADFVRVSPEVKIIDDNTISVAGQNNRYNAIYLDGAVDNDVFGLAGNGQDGGQVGGNPFTFDELDQISVSLAPMDVRQSGFAGGAINATTKSGQNEMFGSLYWFNRNEDLAGKTASYNGKRSKQDEFDANRYGGSLGGAIIKDKLFYFLTYEKEKIETPQFFDFSSYNGDSDQATIQRVSDVFKDKYGYDAGGYGNSTGTLDKDVFVSRIDYNFMKDQSLTFKYKLTKFDSYEAASSGRNINFLDNSKVFPSKKNQFTLDWNGKWNDKLSTKVLLTYKTVRDDRDPNGEFPSIQIQDGSGSIYLGAERYSTANRLDQDVFTGIANLTYNTGDHNILFGIQYDNIQSLNIFIRENYGYYRWFNESGNGGKTGVQRFLEGANPNSFSRTYSLVDANNVAGDDNEKAGADFETSTYSAYLQDEWNVARGLDITAGIRIDVPTYDETRLNEEFNNEIPKFEAAGYNLEGAKTGMKFNEEVHVSPRLGFRYRLNQGKEFATTFNGGVGVFTSRMPLVWIGGAYNNTGNTLGSVSSGDGSIPFSTDITTNNGLSAGSSRPEINIFSEDFKLPQRLKFSIGANQKLPQGFRLKLNYQYDNVLNDVFYQNINIKPYGYLNNDGRLVWSQYNDKTNYISDKFGNVLLGTNTDKGYAYTISAGLDKTFFNNTYVSLNYSYNDAYSVNNGTSSQNLSQWRYQPTINGKNTEVVYRSNYSMGSRVTGQVSTTLDWNIKGKFNTRTIISAFYEGSSGSPISYTYNEGNNYIINDINYSGYTLIYVPKDINDINLVDNYKGYSKEEQWEALDRFISSDEYLSDRRGKFAERNESRTPWTDIVDVKVQQEFDLLVSGRKHTLGFSLDIFNFTNLLNKDWGRRYNYNYGIRTIIDVVDVKDENGRRTAEFGVNPASLTDEKLEPYDNSGINSSLWQMQFGIRYSF